MSFPFSVRTALWIFLGAFPLAARANDAYPSKNLRMVVPFPAGGATDVLGRAIAQRLSEQLGKHVVIENVGGASTMIGAERVAKSNPDGYTLLMATSTTFSTNPHLYKKMNYKLDDFIAVTLFAKGPLALAMSPSIPVKTLQEFAAYAKARPGQLNYGTTGRGGNSHLTGIRIAAALGIRMQDVPYKGSAPALVDVMGGSLSMHIDQVSTSLPLHKSGKINVLAVTSDQRPEAAPEVPTFAELGYQQLVIHSLIALFAPAATPKAVVDKLNVASKAVLQGDQVRSHFRPLGTLVEWSTSNQAMEMFRADYMSAGALIRSMKIEME